MKGYRQGKICVSARHCWARVPKNSKGYSAPLVQAVAQGGCPLVFKDNVACFKLADGTPSDFEGYKAFLEQYRPDIVAGIESGLDTLLVLSGVTTREMVDRFPYRPRVIAGGVGEIPDAD